MKHLDLFSGIGGFSLAARWAYGDVHKPIAFCEIDKYCQKVLKKHWPDVPIFEDIRSLDGKQFRNVDLVSGGFPCQPFSVAGKRAGKEDDRYLWPEMVRVISETRPRWIVGENVPGIINMELDVVLSDLEGQGYTCGTFIIPACGVNAKHRRNRVWIVAHRSQSRNGVVSEFTAKDRASPDSDTDGRSAILADTNSTGRKEQWGAFATYKEYTALECGSRWEAEPGVCRVVDGLPHQVDRVRGLGNAIVPQVVFELLRMIKAIDEQEKARENEADRWI